MNSKREKRLAVYKQAAGCLGLVALVGSGIAGAVVPTYISDALTSAQSTFTDYLTAAAPSVFAMTIILAAFFLVVRLIKKATH